MTAEVLTALASTLFPPNSSDDINMRECLCTYDFLVTLFTDLSSFVAELKRWLASFLSFV